jgi:hypothetical protein
VLVDGVPHLVVQVDLGVLVCRVDLAGSSVSFVTVGLLPIRKTEIHVMIDLTEIIVAFARQVVPSL